MRVERIIGQYVRIVIRDFSAFFISGALALSVVGTIASTPFTPLPATDQLAGAVIEPTAGPIADAPGMTSRENPAFRVIPSDMQQYTNRSNDARLRKAVR